MKPTYKNFEAKQSKGFLTVPPAGAYVAEIKNVNVIEPTDRNPRTVLELIVDISEGEYTHRYKDLFDENKNRFGDANYRGTFRITVPTEQDDEEDNWIKRKFEDQMFAIQESNPGYAWDWDEKKLKMKKVGISVRNRIYEYNGKTRSTTEIGRLEIVQDVRDGKIKPMKDRDQTQGKTADSAHGFTDVSDDTETPWG